MDIHENARLTPHGRERLAKMILGGQTPEAASEAAGVCPRGRALHWARSDIEHMGFEVAQRGALGWAKHGRII